MGEVGINVAILICSKPCGKMMNLRKRCVGLSSPVIPSVRLFLTVSLNLKKTTLIGHPGAHDPMMPKRCLNAPARLDGRALAAVTVVLRSDRACSAELDATTSTRIGGKSGRYKLSQFDTVVSFAALPTKG